MPVDPFTHTFKFDINGSFIRGEAEFNTDGKASFKMDEWSIPLSREVLSHFINLIELLKKIYESGGTESEINLIRFKKKV